MEVITSLHESLNFKLPPKQRECFYEDFVMESPTRTIELFATSLGETDVSLTVHGPFEYKDIINVSHYYCYDIWFLNLPWFSLCRRILKIQ
jgi:hypothetical protein